MATNSRTYSPSRPVINGVSVGGLTSVAYEEGFDNKIESSGEGQAFPTKDRRGQFCRGTISCEDWVKMLSILTGTVGTFVVYERISGAATFIKHTFTNPVVSAVSLTVSNNKYSAITANFECRAADGTKTIVDMHKVEAAATLPDVVAAEYGGYEINSVVLGSLAITHVTGLTFNMSATIIKSTGDDDLAYTAVDRVDDNLAVSGSLSFEAGFASTSLISQQMLIASAADLVVTVKKAGGTAQKVLTIKSVSFENNSGNAQGKGHTTNSANFTISGSTTLTLTGDTAAVTIADAA